MTETESPAQFFLVTLPGVEDLTLSELLDWVPEASGKIERGGVSVELPLSLGCALNRYLKTPTRILVRLADFGCRDFPKLFKKIRNFDWARWIGDDITLHFTASSRNSRLRMKKRIEATCEEGRAAYLRQKGAPQPGGSGARVLVRLEDDICWLSLDTSGEILHKRGLRPLSSEAPLRETTAASLLRYLESFGAGEGSRELVDPMMGGGTFLLEAAGLREPVDSREFALQVENFPELRPRSISPYSSLVGFEANGKILEAARQNLETVKIDVRCIGEDFFKAQALVGDRKRWVIANPPYGERIRVEGKLSDYYANLMEAIERVVRPERALLLFPEKVQPGKLRIPKCWRLVGQRQFLNGGLPVVAMVYGPVHDGLKPTS